MSYGYSEARTRDGRLVLVGRRRRIAHTNRAWGFYNAVSVVWVDEDRCEMGRESVSLGKFNKEHGPVATGFRRVFDAGSGRFL
jgi:hypothetical protein